MWSYASPVLWFRIQNIKTRRVIVWIGEVNAYIKYHSWATSIVKRVLLVVSNQWMTRKILSFGSCICHTFLHIFFSFLYLQIYKNYLKVNVWLVYGDVLKLSFFFALNCKTLSDTLFATSDKLVIKLFFTDIFRYVKMKIERNIFFKNNFLKKMSSLWLNRMI